MGLVYAVTAGPAVDSDVVSRRLSVTVGGETTTTSFSADSTSFGEVTVPQDAAVVLTLVDVDDAGNVSPASSACRWSARSDATIHRRPAVC